MTPKGCLNIVVDEAERRRKKALEDMKRLKNRLSYVEDKDNDGGQIYSNIETYQEGQPN